MTLEEYIAQLNSLAFWREFTFAQTKFWPKPGHALELADNFVWLGDHAYVIQMKERESPSDDPDVERIWFAKKVLGKATRQVRDSLRFIAEHERITITNEHGHAFEIATKELESLTNIVVFGAGRTLPEECWQKRYHISTTAGFIHVVAAHDYLGILEKLRIPDDIRSYFAYREEVLPKLQERGIEVDEPDIMGAFLSDADIPTPTSRRVLNAFVQDLEDSDLSPLLANLHNHIERIDRPYDYYDILREFARLPRSVWREIKLRLMKSLDAVRDGKFTRPFRLTFPKTDCTFMIVPMDPELPSTGPEGAQVRINGLSVLTYGAMYEAKTSKGVGIQISRDGEYIQIDWCLRNHTWKRDPQIEALLAESNPFREVNERSMDSFFFRD